MGDLESRIARGRGLASVRPIPSSDGQAACTRRASAELVEFRLGPQVVSAGMPAEINYHRFVVGWKHAVNGIPRDDSGLDVDELILVAGAEEDVVDALVDQVRSGLERSRGMCRRQGDGIGVPTTDVPGVDQDIA